MDSGKLRNIAFDLSVENEKDINKLLESLYSAIENGEHESVLGMIEDLQVLYKSSYYEKYTPSNIKIVESITFDLFFGTEGFVRLNNLLTQNTLDTKKVLIDLNDYKTKRIGIVDNLNTIYDLFGEFNIPPHYNSDFIFELGLLMPKFYTKNKIVNITKDLNQWDKILRTLKEVSGETPEDTELSFINNGSFEFFSNIDASIALMVSFTIERVVSLYKKIVEIREAKEKLRLLGVPHQEADTKEVQEQYFLVNVDEIAKELFEKFATKQLEEGRFNELKVAVKGHVTYIAKSLNDGLIIEINPPEIIAPTPVTEDVSEAEKEVLTNKMAKYNKTLKVISIIQKSMEVIKDVGKISSGMIKLFLDGDLDPPTDNTNIG